MKKTITTCDECGEKFNNCDFKIGDSNYTYNITGYSFYGTPNSVKWPRDICKKCLIKALSEK